MHTACCPGYSTRHRPAAGATSRDLTSLVFPGCPASTGERPGPLCSWPCCGPWATPTKEGVSCLAERHLDPLTLARDEVSWAAWDFSELCPFWRCRETALSKSSPPGFLPARRLQPDPHPPPAPHPAPECLSGRHLWCGRLIALALPAAEASGLFPGCATVSRAVMNIHTQVSLHTGFPSIRMMGVCVLNFARDSHSACLGGCAGVSLSQGRSSALLQVPGVPSVPRRFRSWATCGFDLCFPHDR